MKILDRYILWEISGYALLGLAVFTFVLTTPELLRLSELFARQSVPLTTLLKLCATILPGKLVWTIPMAVLVGLLMGWSRLAADGEIVALQATAVGLGRLLRPAVLFAAGGFLLALLSSIWWAPAAARSFRALQAELAAGQVPYAVQPRVFEERFPNSILYVQEVRAGAARWQGIFLAELARPAGAKLTLAEAGIVVNEPARQRLRLHLLNATAHQYAVNNPERYSVSTFGETDIFLPLPEASLTPVGLRRNAERGLAELWAASQQGERWRSFRADFHRRFAVPAACLVFALLAIPLGMAGSSGGRALALVLAFALFAGYYIFFVFTDRFAREGVLPPWLGVWAANLLLAGVGVALLGRLRRPVAGGSWWFAFREFFRAREPKVVPRGVPLGVSEPATMRARQRPDFPRLLDLYIIRGLLFHFVLLLGTFLILYELFNILDLIDDIAKNQVGWGVVAAYLWYLLPQALYWMVPLSALLAVLVELGVLSKRNELVAIKAAGISLYRIASPLLAVGLLLSVGLFFLDFHYLPYTNQRQEARRNQIKGRPPQTVYQPHRKWIFGEGPRIFNYRLFDPRQNLFGELSLLELAPDGFSIRRRVYARRVRWEPRVQNWIFEQGWQRTFAGQRTADYQPFTRATFPELSETPDYFKKEVRESAQMNFRELGSYIAELRQSGFEVGQLLVQWHKKFAFPLTAFVMILLGFPFGLTTGKRGALGGIAFGIALGIIYWVLGALFEAFGNLQLLPALLAAWGPNLIFAFAGFHWLLRIET